MELKQVILVRTDLKMDKGKTAAQSAHASVEAVFKSNKETIKKWKSQGMKKVVLRVEDLKEMLKYNQLAKDQNLKTAVISDAGRTVLKPGTKTCCAIGPDEETKINQITGNLPIL